MTANRHSRNISRFKLFQNKNWIELNRLRETAKWACALRINSYPVNMSNAIGSSRESNPSRRISHQHAVPLSYVANKCSLIFALSYFGFNRSKWIGIYHQTLAFEKIDFYTASVTRQVRKCNHVIKWGNGTLHQSKMKLATTNIVQTVNLFFIFYPADKSWHRTIGRDRPGPARAAMKTRYYGLIYRLKLLAHFLDCSVLSLLLLGDSPMTIRFFFTQGEDWEEEGEGGRQFGESNRSTNICIF